MSGRAGKGGAQRGEPTDAARSDIQRVKEIGRVVWPVLVSGVALSVFAWVRWHLSTEQLSFLLIGLGCLLIAWMAWKHGVIGYSYSRQSVEHGASIEEVSIKEAPRPRGVLAALLIGGGLMFILAGSPLQIARVFRVPAHAAVVLWQFGNATWNLVIGLVFVGGPIVMVGVSAMRRDHEDLGLWVFVTLFVVAFLGGANYLFYRLAPEDFAKSWREFTSPFRAFLDLFT
jgi:hypothetical protein